MDAQQASQCDLNTCIHGEGYTISQAHTSIDYLTVHMQVGAPLGIYSAYEYTHTAESTSDLLFYCHTPRAKLTPAHDLKFKSPGCIITQSGSLTRALVVVTTTEISE